MTAAAIAARDAKPEASAPAPAFELAAARSPPVAGAPGADREPSAPVRGSATPCRNSRGVSSRRRLDRPEAAESSDATAAAACRPPLRSFGASSVARRRAGFTSASAATRPPSRRRLAVACAAASLMRRVTEPPVRRRRDGQSRRSPRQTPCCRRRHGDAQAQQMLPRKANAAASLPRVHSEPARRFDDLWLRAMVLAPDLQYFMSVTLLGTPDTEGCATDAQALRSGDDDLFGRSDARHEFRPLQRRRRGLLDRDLRSTPSRFDDRRNQPSLASSQAFLLKTRRRHARASGDLSRARAQTSVSMPSACM